MMKILVSACLLGDPVRYDGHSVLNEAVKKLNDKHELIRFCPEMAGGLPVPREASELQGTAGIILIQAEEHRDPAEYGTEQGHKQNRSGVYSCSGHNVTSFFLKGAQEALTLCRLQGIDTAILKERSPSCGSQKIYDGSFQGRTIPGRGLTAELLVQNGIRVLSEENLADLCDGQEIP